MHGEALTKEATTLLPLLGRFKDFYLVGGTALALQIGTVFLLILICFLRRSFH